MASIFDNPATGLPTIFGPNLFEEEIIEYDNISPAFVPNFERVVTQQYNLPDRDIQAESMQLYNDQAMSDLEFKERYLEEVKKTQAMAMFSALAAGRTPQIPSVPSMPKMSSSAGKPEDKELGLAWEIFRSNPPSNEREMAKFIETYKIGPNTADFLRKQLPVYDEGNMIPLRRWNSEANKMEVIYRPENTDLSNELEAGFTLQESDATRQEDMAKLARTQTAVALARQDYIGQRLKSNKDLKKFFDKNNITDPEIVSTIQGLYPDLVNENDLVPLYSDDGSLVYVSKADENEYLQNKNYTRPDQVNNAINSLATSTMDEIFGRDRIPTKLEVSDEVFRSLEGQPYDAEKIQKQIDARYGKESRVAMTAAEIVSYGLGRDVKSLEQITEKFNKPEQAEALASALDKLATLNPMLVFDPTKIPAVMYDSKTGTKKDIFNQQDYVDALRTGYQKDRPPIGTGVGKTFSPPPEPSNVNIAQFVVSDGKTTTSERRYTTQGAVELAADFKQKASETIEQNTQFKQNFADIVNNLAQRTPATDYNAIRAMEKLYDPNGVVRGSDIENLFNSLGGGFNAQFEKLLAKAQGGSIVLTQFERDMLAHAANAAYTLRVDQMKNNIAGNKRLYEHTGIKPWDSEARAKRGEKDWDYNMDVYNTEDLAKEYASPNYPGTQDPIFNYYTQNIAEHSLQTLQDPSSKPLYETDEEQGIMLFKPGSRIRRKSKADAF
jgi:hypothetical protein